MTDEKPGVPVDLTAEQIKAREAAVAAEVGKRQAPAPAEEPAEAAHESEPS